MNFVKKVIYFNIVPLIGSLFNKRSKFVNVIYYHDIVRGKGYSSQQTNVDIFKKQMKYLHDNGYVTYTFDELENTENLKFCYKHIVITFDDGWISNYTEIFDFMKSLKLKYNIFLSMGKIGVDKSYLTWDSVREMHNSGIVGFGAHSFTHPSMADVNAINPNLEIIEVDQITKKVYGQKNFWKLYLSDFLHVLGDIENKQVAILKYILDNTHPSTNMFIGTYKTIQKNTHTSEATIAKVMKKITKSKNFLIKIQNGLWQVSPNIMMKGNENKKRLLLNYFNTDESINK